MSDMSDSTPFVDDSLKRGLAGDGARRGERAGGRTRIMSEMRGLDRFKRP